MTRSGCTLVVFLYSYISPQCHPKESKYLMITEHRDVVTRGTGWPRGVSSVRKTEKFISPGAFSWQHDTAASLHLMDCAARRNGHDRATHRQPEG